MKKLNGIILGLVIILLLAAMCVGVGVFIKKDSESNSKISKLEEQITEIKSSNKINVENNVDNENQQNQISNITKNDYEIFAKNLKKQISKYDNNNSNYQCNYQYVENVFIKDGYKVYLTKNGELYVNYLNKELNTKYGEYKIADNVLMFYIINSGQDVGNMLYFINEDGTVGMADTEYGISSNNTIKVEKDIGYKNIVSIVNGLFSNEYSGVHGPIFIDINGNIFAENLK